MFMPIKSTVYFCLLLNSQDMHHTIRQPYFDMKCTTSKIITNQDMIEDIDIVIQKAMMQKGSDR